MKIRVIRPIAAIQWVEIEVPDDRHNPSYQARAFVLAALQAEQPLVWQTEVGEPDMSEYSLKTEPDWIGWNKAEPAPVPKMPIEIEIIEAERPE